MRPYNLFEGMFCAGDLEKVGAIFFSIVRFYIFSRCKARVSSSVHRRDYHYSDNYCNYREVWMLAKVTAGGLWSSAGPVSC